MVGSLLLPGCTNVHTWNAVFPAPYLQTFNSAHAVLSLPSELGLPIMLRDVEEGIVETGWVEKPGTVTQGLILRDHYQERFRYRIEVSEEEPGWTRVEVSGQRETRPPGGRRAYRWTRVPPVDAALVEMLRRIGQQLSEKTKLPAPTEGE